MKVASFFGLIAAGTLQPASSSVIDPSQAEDAQIIVTAQRAMLAEQAADQAVIITSRPPKDVPLARRYEPICIRLFGIDPAYGAAIAERIRSNIRAIGLPVGDEKCQPNVLIGFEKDSKAAVARLFNEQPAMFNSLKQHEIERIFGGSGAVQVWHATEVRSVDGRPIPIFEERIPGVARPIEARVNWQYAANRLGTTIRHDVNASIILFDRERADGRSVRQLADHATFRLLVPVQDEAEVSQKSLTSILHLFAKGGGPVDGLTEFDWAFLAGYYNLDRGAKLSAVHDATRKMILNGTAQRLFEGQRAD